MKRWLLHPPRYVEGFIESLKSFLQNHSEEGKNELNTVCHTHNITLGPSSAVNYCGTSITNGTLNLLFHPEKLAANIDDVGSTLAETISSAAKSENTGLLSYAARHSIKTQYEPKIGDILEKCRKTLQNPDLKFEAGFEELAKMLKGSKDARDDWETNVGDFARDYFDGFEQALEREGFGKDELLREGFEEGCEKGTIRLKIVEKLKGGSGYNEVVLEDGEVLLQTTPEKWGVNISNAADKLVDIL